MLFEQLLKLVGPSESHIGHVCVPYSPGLNANDDKRVLKASKNYRLLKAPESALGACHTNGERNPGTSGQVPGLPEHTELPEQQEFAILPLRRCWGLLGTLSSWLSKSENEKAGHLLPLPQHHSGNLPAVPGHYEWYILK